MERINPGRLIGILSLVATSLLLTYLQGDRKGMDGFERVQLHGDTELNKQDVEPASSPSLLSSIIVVEAVRD